MMRNGMAKDLLQAIKLLDPAVECFLSHSSSRFECPQIIRIAVVWRCTLGVFSVGVSSVCNSFLPIRNHLLETFTTCEDALVGLSGFERTTHPHQLAVEEIERKLVGQAGSMEFVRVHLFIFGKRWMLHFMKSTVYAIDTDDKGSLKMIGPNDL